MKIETFDLLEFENANSHEKKIYAKMSDWIMFKDIILGRLRIW